MKGEIGRGNIGTQGNMPFNRQTPGKAVAHSSDTGQKEDCRQFLQATSETKCAQQFEIASGDFAFHEFRCYE